MLICYWAAISIFLPQTGEKLGEGREKEAEQINRKISLHSLHCHEFLSAEALPQLFATLQCYMDIK